MQECEQEEHSQIYSQVTITHRFVHSLMWINVILEVTMALTESCPNLHQVKRIRFDKKTWSSVTVCVRKTWRHKDKVDCLVSWSQFCVWVSIEKPSQWDQQQLQKPRQQQQQLTSNLLPLGFPLMPLISLHSH